MGRRDLFAQVPRTFLFRGLKTDRSTQRNKQISCSLPGSKITPQRYFASVKTSETLKRKNHVLRTSDNCLVVRADACHSKSHTFLQFRCCRQRSTSAGCVLRPTRSLAASNNSSKAVSYCNLTATAVSHNYGESACRPVPSFCISAASII